MNRRSFLGLGTTAALVAAAARSLEAAPRLKLTRVELLPIRATSRTVWLIVRLHTDAGLTGLGEASDAFGYANTTAQDAVRMDAELRRFFEIVKGRSPLEIGAYRQRGWPLAASGGLVPATAFGAIEQALWDLAGKALDVPRALRRRRARLAQGLREHQPGDDEADAGGVCGDGASGRQRRLPRREGRAVGRVPASGIVRRGD